MFKRYWDGTLAVGLTLGASIAVNILVWLSVGWDWIDSEITSADPSAYAANQCSKQQSTGTTSGFPVLNEDKPYANEAGAVEADSGQNGQPDWCDLAAQQSMAYSTVGMKRATWLMAVLTIFGVGLLYRTLVLTRGTLEEAKETVRVTRRIGEKQARAYVHPTSADIVQQSVTGEFSVVVTIKNWGATPTRETHIQWGQALGIITDEFWGGLADAEMIAISSLGPGQNYKAQFKIQPDFLDEIKTKTFQVFGRLHYSDVFGDGHFTDFLYTNPPSDLFAAQEMAIGNSKYNRST